MHATTLARASIIRTSPRPLLSRTCNGPSTRTRPSISLTPHPRGLSGRGRQAWINWVPALCSLLCRNRAQRRLAMGRCWTSSRMEVGLRTDKWMTPSRSCTPNNLACTEVGLRTNKWMTPSRSCTPNNLACTPSSRTRTPIRRALIWATGRPLSTQQRRRRRKFHVERG